MEEVIEKFSEIFCKSLQMLDREIEENKENLFTHFDVFELTKEWNNLYDKYFGGDENE